MRVLFDHQAFSMQTHGGVSRCFAELYKSLPTEQVEADIAINETDNAYLCEMGIGRPRGYDLEHFIAPFHFPMKGRMFSAYNHFVYGLPYHPNNQQYFWGNEYQKIQSIKALTKGSFDVFHPTYFDDYFLSYLKGKPFVLTIHDMIPERYPEFFKRDDFQILKKRVLAPKASAIIAVSETTKNDIVDILKISEDKVHVVYHGCSFPDVKEEISPIVKAPYILYVGERHAYKNFDLFIKYVGPVLRKYPEINVVCTGKPFAMKELKLMDCFNVKDRFIHHWVSADKDLFSLYHYAICFVYTSEYEGFGIPIIEAYKADCPVMLNKASCFPEIAGGAAIYFNMNSEDSDFSQQFEHLYSMTYKEREDLLSKQRQRLQRYSWEKSAKQLVDIYRSLI